MKTLAVIPARGGSKRLPNKNILPLGGKPLIYWTIEAATGVSEVVEILVSTDSEEIASAARAAGALVPWLRPAELSTDTASSIDVCLHALDWYVQNYGDIDGLLLLQPTSPFRKAKTISEGMALFNRYGCNRPVISVSPADSHPMWCYSIINEQLKPFIDSIDLKARSQDLPRAYVINGALYLASPEFLRKYRSFVCERTVPLVIDSKSEGLDIDTKSDLIFAEYLLSKEIDGILR